MKFGKYILVAIATFLSVTAQADPIQMGVTYQLGNHPDGGARPPLYGLRLDGLTTGNTNDIFTFDFETMGAAMTMVWNADGTLSISGNAYGGLNENGGYAAGMAVLWAIDFTYDPLGNCTDGSGLCTGAGAGTISSSFGNYDLNAVSGSHSYAFQLDYNHRGFDGVSGWGWMNHCPSRNPDGSTQDVGGGNCDTHLYASDWLFTVQTVPEPGTLALMGLGLLGLGLHRRRKLVAVAFD